MFSHHARDCFLYRMSHPTVTNKLTNSDYFSNFKGSTTELAPFLGGSMAAKVSPLSLTVMSKLIDRWYSRIRLVNIVSPRSTIMPKDPRLYIRHSTT